jgi:enoyl-CoA hydratase/carnithine racemase
MDNKNLSLEGLIFEAIELSVVNNIMCITLNRPEKKNAINPVMANEIIYSLAFAAQERDIRVVVIKANGDVFCAGGDLGTMSGKSSESTSNVPSLGGGTEEISLRIRSLNKPVICEIQGPVLAGALLMVTNSTHAIAVEEATFSAPEIKRGIWPFMVMAGLFRVMPKRQGLDFIMRGNKISSHDAERFGLSQLHQLRGRVGRGTKESFCILMHSETLSEISKERLINVLPKGLQSKLKLKSKQDLYL